MISNISYYHIEQGVGKVFVPGLLRGYFNDLTGKRNWSGIVDKMGIPVCLLFDGSKTYFPTTIIQKALGHWDWYLLTNQKNELDEFLKICDWLIKHQKKNGGWEIADELLPDTISHFSAMPQGEAISTLVRAWQVTFDDRFLAAATKAYRLLVTPIELGGTSNYISGELFFEELPTVPKNTILNGWIFALFGIYDFHLVNKDLDAKTTFRLSLNTLINNLQKYDTGFWSYYDESDAFSSPFYHNLHISQLEALYKLTHDKTIKNYIVVWKEYRESFFKRNYAFLKKVYQKLKNPNHSFIIK